MDALTSDEIRTISQVLRSGGKLDDTTRVVSYSLDENPKTEVRAWKPGQPFARHGAAVLIKDGKLYEAQIDVGSRSLVSWKEIPNRQAALTVVEMMGAGEVVKKDPRWQAAMAKRSITDFKNVLCLPLTVGPVFDPPCKGHRLLNVPCVDTTGAGNNLWGSRSKT